MGPEKSNTQHSINRDRFATAKEGMDHRRRIAGRIEARRRSGARGCVAMRVILGCHAEQREASRIFKLSRRRDYWADSPRGDG